MNTFKRLHVVSFLLMLILVASATAQETYRLQYKFQKGSTHRYRATTDNNVTQEMQGQEMKILSSTKSVVRLVVDRVADDGSMVLVVSADSAVTRSQTPMRDTTMVMNNMIGKRMKLTIDKLGKITAREVVDSVQFESRGMNIRSPQREAMTLIVLPAKELKVSDKWADSKTDTIDVGAGKMVNVTDVEYTLAGKESRSGHDCLKITYSGKISTNGKMKQMGMDMFTEGTGKITGTMYFDHAKGLLVSDESTMDVESTIAVTGQQNMTIPMTSSVKTVRELLGD